MLGRQVALEMQGWYTLVGGEVWTRHIDEWEKAEEGMGQQGRAGPIKGQQ